MTIRNKIICCAAALAVTLLTGCQTAENETIAPETETTVSAPAMSTTIPTETANQPANVPGTQTSESASEAIPGETVTWGPEETIPTRVTTAKLPDEAGGSRNLLIKFFADIVLDGKPQEVSLFYFQAEDASIYGELTVGSQVLRFPLEDIFWPETVEKGLQICDVNQDGYPDLIAEQGTMNGCSFANCFVYCPGEGYAEIPAFTGLYNPTWLEESGMVLEQWNSGSAFFLNRYRISGTELTLAESLAWKYTASGSPRYTQKELVDGQMVTVKQNALESEIDLDSWYR